MRGCKRRSNQIARHKRRATSLKDVRYAKCRNWNNLHHTGETPDENSIPENWNTVLTIHSPLLFPSYQFS